jgi:septal ring factor EnvC (AmiA/AmiB activator)
MNMNHRQRTIFARYTEAMIDVTTNGLIEIQTAQLVLALALRDLESAMSAVKADDAGIAGSIVHHIERMIDHNAHDLYERLLSGKFTTVDQALTVHFQRTDQELFNLREDLDAARKAHAVACAQRDSLQVQLLELDDNNHSLTQEITRLRSWTVDADARAAAAQPPPVVSAFEESQP